MEEDIKILEKLIEKFDAPYGRHIVPIELSYDERNAIKNLIARNKELKEENKGYHIGFIDGGIVKKYEYQFLKEYEKLCQKYKMGLCGCGCCDSPYLAGAEKEIGDINYNKKLNCLFIGGSGFWHELEKKERLNAWEEESYDNEKTLQDFFKQ